jgi:hypothetical protein
VENNACSSPILLSFGEKLKPKFGMNFPAKEVTTNHGVVGF